MGLLLVTRVLPAGDVDAVRRVYDAVGPAFVSRLLAPLRGGGGAASNQAPLTLQAAQKQVATAALGIAVLSSFVRVPALAAAGELVDKLPLFLKVVRAGGVTPVVAAAAGVPLPADPETDAAAVRDALECALAVALSGTVPRQVAAECGAVGAAAAALQRAAASGAHGAPLHQTQMLAVGLASAVLAAPDRAAALAASGPDVQLLVGGLARLLPLPALQQHEAPEERARGAQLQLEALHALLQLLPLPRHAPAGLHDALGRAARRGGWAGDMRAGLALLLRGRAGPVQRHSALQLAAAVVGVAGPAWLLGPASAPGGGEVGDAGAFFQLLVEITKIETSVLLHDALSPAAQVPLASHPGAAAAEWRAPLPRGGGGGGELPGDADGAEDDNELSDEEPIPGWDDLPSVFPPGSAAALAAAAAAEAEAAAAAKRPRGRAPAPGEVVELTDSVQIPAEMHWEGPSEAAGSRAARVLPACFALLEAEVEALAGDAQRAEDADAYTPAAPAPAPAPLGSRAGSGGAPPAPPPLPAGVAARAIGSLHEALDVILQFLEQTLPHGGGDHGGAAALDPGQLRQRQQLTVGAVRVAGRFAAEVPGAFGPRLRALLPDLIEVRSPPRGEAANPDGTRGGGGAGGAAPGSSDSGSGSDSMDDLLDGPAEGLLFLMPLLMQVTHPSWGADPAAQGGEGAGAGSEQAAWLEAVAQPRVLRSLVEHAAAAAGGCARTVTEAWDDDAAAEALTACTLLLHILQPRAGGGGGGGRGGGGWASPHAGEALPLVWPLIEALGGAPLRCDDDCSPEEALEQAR